MESNMMTTSIPFDFCSTAKLITNLSIPPIFGAFKQCNNFIILS